MLKYTILSIQFAALVFVLYVTGKMIYLIATN